MACWRTLLLHTGVLYLAMYCIHGKEPMESTCSIKPQTEKEPSILPSLKTGLFADVIGCSGTLSTVEANGFCVVDEAVAVGTTVGFRMMLHIMRNETLVARWLQIMPGNGLCGNAKTYTLSISNYTNNIEVMAGDVIAVETEECTNTTNTSNRSTAVCPFLPVTNTSDMERCIGYNENGNFGQLETICGLRLNLKTSIIDAKTPVPESTNGPGSLPESLLALWVSIPLALLSGVLCLGLGWALYSRRNKQLRRSKGSRERRRMLIESILEPTANQEDVNVVLGMMSQNHKVITQDLEQLQHSYDLIDPLEDGISVTCSPEPHYCTAEDGEGPYWEPSSTEDVLRAQLHESGVLSISEDNIQLSDELGSGEFGVVRRGVWSVGGEEREVAVKSLAGGSTEEKRIQFLQEAAIMGQFKHPNVISLCGALLDSDPMMLVVELMTNGNLRDYLPPIRSRFTGDAFASCKEGGTLLSFCQQVASGMTYLAGRGFVHRDLAARNILVSDTDHCKIADFGMSRALQDTDYYISRGGKIPVKWTAPEALHYKKYSTASDVWSFGVVLYEIWSLGMKPFHNLTNTEAYNKISAGHILPPPPGCPRKIYILMLKCWRLDPDSRPTFSQILPEFQNPDFKFLLWAEEDVAAYTEVARTLGAPLEAGEELYMDLRQF